MALHLKTLSSQSVILRPHRSMESSLVCLDADKFTPAQCYARCLESVSSHIAYGTVQYLCEYAIE